MYKLSFADELVKYSGKCIIFDSLKSFPSYLLRFKVKENSHTRKKRETL